MLEIELYINVFLIRMMQKLDFTQMTRERELLLKKPAFSLS